MKDNKIKHAIKKYGKYAAIGAVGVAGFVVGKKYTEAMFSAGLYSIAKSGKTLTDTIDGVEYVLSLTPKQ